MDVIRGVFGLAATAFIAGGVAYSVSAPRNVENALNQPMDELGGSSIAQEMKKTQDHVRSEQCIKFKELANEQWERSLENDRVDSDSDKVEYLDRQIEHYCQ